MSTYDIERLSRDELAAKLSEKEKSLMNLRFQKAYGQLNDTSVFKKLRKDIARIKMYMCMPKHKSE